VSHLQVFEAPLNPGAPDATPAGRSRGQSRIPTCGVKSSHANRGLDWPFKDG
jgi:hypothetical protein